MTEAAYFSAISTKEKIDGAAGVIYGVSVITKGEAAGRNAGTWIDDVTLSQLVQTASKYPDGIKVKLSQSKEHDGSAGQIAGVLKTFRIEGPRVRANLHLLKAGENFAKIIEMSEVMPTEFGLSVVMPKELETVGGKECLRCSEIYSVDLVEAPAANPSGLFSSKTPETSMNSKIKYAKGESGDHAEECMCKDCKGMSKKEMSAYVASLIGLSETATETEIQAVFKASKSGTGDLAALTAKLASLESSNANALALSKKAEIDNLVAEATRLGKVVPLDNDDLYTVKDGICTVKMEPTQLSKLISKLTPGKIKLTRQVEPPKAADGKPITDRRSDQFKTALSAKREEGAEQLNQLFASLNKSN